RRPLRELRTRRAQRRHRRKRLVGEARHPAAAIRRVDDVRLAAALHDRCGLVVDLVGGRLDGDAGLAEPRFDVPVANDGVGIVVRAVEQRARARAPRERTELRGGLAFEQREVGAQFAQLAAQPGERIEEELHDRRAHARPAQQRRVEHERADDAFARLRGTIQRDVVVEPEVAAQPYDRDGKASRPRHERPLSPANAAAMAIRIAVEPLDLPLKHTFTIARSSESVAKTVVVRLRWNGLEGLGESAPSERYAENVAGVSAGLRTRHRAPRPRRERRGPSAVAAARARPGPHPAHVVHDRHRTARRDDREGARGRRASRHQGEAGDRRGARDAGRGPRDLYRDDSHRRQRRLDARTRRRAAARDGTLRDRVLRAADSGRKSGAAALDPRTLADPDRRRRRRQGRARPSGAARRRRRRQREAREVRRDSGRAAHDPHRARAGAEAHAGVHARVADPHDRGGAAEPAGRLGGPRRPLPHRGGSVRRNRLRARQDRAPERPGTRRARARGGRALKRRYLVLTPYAFTTRAAKMAHGVIAYSSDDVVAVVDPDHAGRRVVDVMPYLRSDAPFVGSVSEGLRFDPTALLVGIAPKGGALPETFRAAIREALQAKLEVVSGLHAMLSDDPEFAALARAQDTRIWDLRLPPPAPIFSGAAWDVEAKIVLTVGSDGAVGKMTAALELLR